jgi:hypothetical protein
MTKKRKLKTVTTLSLHPRRFPGFPRGGVRILMFLLATAALSLKCRQAAASDLFLQNRSEDKPYAVIFTTVWGPDDRPVYGVKVKIRRENEKKARWEGYSDHHGEFAVRVPAGKAVYVAWADLKGYKSPNGGRLEPGDNVTIHVEYDERVDTGLHLK